jgi:protein gp37
VGDKTAIEWTTATWNPVTGCDRVSEGCDHCYALTLAKRLKAMGNPRYQVDGDPRRSGPGFGVTLHEDQLDLPLRWRRPRRIFVNSMSDLFHDEVPDDFIARVFAVMGLADHHTFQVLTKRPGRMASLLRSESFRESWFRARLDRAVHAGVQRMNDRGEIGLATEWPLPNVWLGTSVENQKWADVRIPRLLETPAAVRFLSCEPLLGPVDLRPFLGIPEATGETGNVQVRRARSRPAAHWPAASRLDWIIGGGESGPGHRPMDPDWARSLRDHCNAAGVPFFFKQWGGATPKAGGRELDGREWNDLPQTPAPANAGL